MEPRTWLKRENYDRFVGEFADRISRRFPDVCFYLYGSYITGKPTFGRSDVDGGMILDCDFVSDKKQVLEMANVLYECVNNNPVRTQFNLVDRATCRDGRFLSYDKSYTDWIKKAGRVVCGPAEFVQEMQGFLFREANLHSAAYNFRSIRNGLLLSTRDHYYNHRELRTGLENAMENLLSLPKKLIWLQRGRLVDNRATAITQLQKMFPSLDLDFIRHVRTLSRNTKEWYGVIEEDSKRAFGYRSRVLTAFEEMIKAYISKFPVPSEKEVRD